MIEGVSIIPLKQIHDERGKIMHMLRADQDHFQMFGEIYFSCIYPEVIKAWHIHTEMTLNYAVISGKIKLVMYDDRDQSQTKGRVQEIFLSPENYQLVIIPPMVWNGFKGLGDQTSIVANCSTLPHDPDEIKRMDPFSSKIPYKWDLKHG